MKLDPERAARYAGLDCAIRRYDPTALPRLHRLLDGFRERSAARGFHRDDAFWGALGAALAAQEIENAEDARQWHAELRAGNWLFGADPGDAA